MHHRQQVTARGLQSKRLTASLFSSKEDSSVVLLLTEQPSSNVNFILKTSQKDDVHKTYKTCTLLLAWLAGMVSTHRSCANERELLRFNQ
mmetsp:Transcript_4414/g.10273  ORF Transcript_4414/g.10273 Transcript_4414/m.10273 type:complete len:90 (-) Transcript_4414:731-1000(-)